MNQDELAARLAKLDDFGRKSVLAYLAGFVPEAVAQALDELDAQAADSDDG